MDFIIQFLYFQKQLKDQFSILEYMYLPIHFHNFRHISQGTRKIFLSKSINFNYVKNIFPLTTTKTLLNTDKKKGLSNMHKVYKF